ncbi:hypothetical protein PVAP13_5KG588700 [Panicum virgatum]|uniref:Uncharacterized protein n=1 Tax=Panicum virgatum TaxID=38727 RepID=A0A8T0SVU3_PANVG|nr:hypothetical protein PVAP13_5KG588700 [Panicum virgatum]
MGRPRGELAHDHPARARREPNRQLIALTLSQSLGQPAAAAAATASQFGRCGRKLTDFLAAFACFWFAQFWALRLRRPAVCLMAPAYKEFEGMSRPRHPHVTLENAFSMASSSFLTTAMVLEACVSTGARPALWPSFSCGQGEVMCS